jgi:predicted transcriptional regulator
VATETPKKKGEKMTIREFYNEVINANINEDMTNKATELLAALDARNEKRKGTESKEKKEAAERREVVLEFLKTHEGAFTRDQIAFEVDMDPAKVSGACTALVKSGLVAKSEIKVEKSRKVAYSIA